MTGIAEAIAAISGIKTIADGLVSMRDETKVMETKLALMGQLMDIRQALDSLQDQLAAVKAEKAKLQQENLELQQRLNAVDEYDLVQLVGGVHVLTTKPADGTPHKPPYYCQACHSDGKKSVLSFSASAFGQPSFPAYMRCQRNDAHKLTLPGGTQAAQLGYAK